MNLTIPFTKDIKFTTSIGEILSVSLEHDYTVNPGGVLGNFTVSGEYKVHEVSVSKEHFEYVLPFSVDIPDSIDLDTIDFTIENFTYELEGSDILRVFIEYNVKAKEKKLDEVQVLLDELEREENIEEVLDEVPKEEDRPLIEIEREENTPPVEDTPTNTTIIDSINNTTDTYVTYHIHIMNELDTIDAICTKYNTTKEELEQYNEISTLSFGDKIIIPFENE